MEIETLRKLEFKNKIKSLKIDEVELIKDSIFKMVLGDYIACGDKRFVFDFAMNELFNVNWVVKLCAGHIRARSQYTNVKEHQSWFAACDRCSISSVPTKSGFKTIRPKDKVEITDWLAPVRGISRCGKILLQEKTSPITDREIPKMLPNVLHDLHAGNFGLLNGKIVAHDYEYLHDVMLQTDIIKLTRKTNR